MKINLELEIDPNDLFITNKGVLPFKEIKDGYLIVGKYRCRIMDACEVCSVFDLKEIVQKYRWLDGDDVIELKLIRIKHFKGGSITCWRVEECVNQQIKYVSDYPDGCDHAYRHFCERKIELDNGLYGEG